MKKFIIIPLTLILILSTSINVNAYFSEDLLSTKMNVLGCGSLQNDINNDGKTNVLDILEMKRVMFIDAQNMNPITN